ncbi:hypothetical protein BDR07DRAFT_1380451 [Suillus spraguei]|nr:hypothetical protein BDR07DRAFT_1380451 [Suillus spraguei]
MSSRENQADILAKKHFGHEVFDMCWNTDADEVLMVETLTATPSAKPHFGGQTFGMCWDTELDPMPIITVHAATPPVAGQYDLCWEDKMSPSKRVTVEDVAIPLTAGQYDMCWNDQPSPLAVGYKADFDMCWGDSPSGRESLQSGPTTAPTTNSVNLIADAKESSESQAFHNMCFDNDSPAASPAPRDDLPSQIVHAESIDSMTNYHSTGDDQGPKSTDILNANWDLILEYQNAHD